MKTTQLSLACILATFVPATAATSVFGSYAEISTTSSTVYVGSSYGGSNPALDGASFGSFDAGTDSLTISNASLVTAKSGGGDVTGAEIQWRVYEVGSTPGAFAAASVGFGANATATDLGGQTFTGGGDQEWRGLSGGSIDLLGAASGNGDYEVEVFFRAFTNEGDRFSNNGGSNFTASFTVVPEPTVAVLGCLGLLGLLRRRRA